MIYLALNIERYIYFAYQSIQSLLNRQGVNMDKFALEILKIDQDDPKVFEKWAALVELYYPGELEKEQVKHMRQCAALIGEL